jgi:hypothetical protein
LRAWELEDGKPLREVDSTRPVNPAWRNTGSTVDPRRGRDRLSTQWRKKMIAAKNTALANGGLFSYEHIQATSQLIPEVPFNVKPSVGLN